MYTFTALNKHHQLAAVEKRTSKAQTTAVDSTPGMFSNEFNCFYECQRRTACISSSQKTLSIIPKSEYLFNYQLEECKNKTKDSTALVLTFRLCYVLKTINYGLIFQNSPPEQQKGDEGKRTEPTHQIWPNLRLRPVNLDNVYFFSYKEREVEEEDEVKLPKIL